MSDYSEMKIQMEKRFVEKAKEFTRVCKGRHIDDTIPVLMNMFMEVYQWGIFDTEHPGWYESEMIELSNSFAGTSKTTTTYEPTLNEVLKNNLRR